MDYRDMTIWQLRQEQARIDAELARRTVFLGVEVRENPNLPADVMEFYASGKVYRITNLG